MVDVSTHREEIVARMQSLGLYKVEFMPTIERLAMLYVQREKLEKQFADSGGNAVIMHTNKVGATNAAKNPFLTARDEVYTQLLAHEKELGLTPSSLRRINELALTKPTKKSTLSSVLTSLEKSGGGMTG